MIRRATRVVLATALSALGGFVIFAMGKASAINPDALWVCVAWAAVVSAILDLAALLVLKP